MLIFCSCIGGQERRFNTSVQHECVLITRIDFLVTIIVPSWLLIREQCWISMMEVCKFGSKLDRSYLFNSHVSMWLSSLLPADSRHLLCSYFVLALVAKGEGNTIEVFMFSCPTWMCIDHKDWFSCWHYNCSIMSAEAAVLDFNDGKFVNSAQNWIWSYLQYLMSPLQLISIRFSSDLPEFSTLVIQPRLDFLFSAVGAVVGESTFFLCCCYCHLPLVGLGCAAFS
jgi:hypothetical protein